eukprot:TRINITY_DN14206_c0_g1_i1.p1 TRINITY_DN14206_c0_g1~~TRINITY_DN14206_c0_g1_i1.p1  ORF type:complete len:285 (+),score=29.20 TRINITY_DN14206_c0_g1_i1:44-898(+)
MGCCYSRERSSLLAPLPLSEFLGGNQQDGLVQTASVPVSFRSPDVPATAAVERISSSPGFHEDCQVRRTYPRTGSAPVSKTEIVKCLSTEKLAQVSKSEVVKSPSTEKRVQVSKSEVVKSPSTEKRVQVAFAGDTQSSPKEGSSVPLGEAVASTSTAARPSQLAVKFQPGFLHLRGLTMNLEDPSATASATASTGSPSEANRASFTSVSSLASTASSGGDERHRDDFGVGFGGRCGECGKKVYANRGCFACKIHICKPCFQGHECDAYAASHGKPASARRFTVP